MRQVNTEYTTAMNSKVRQMVGKVYFYDSNGTLKLETDQNGAIQNIDIDRVGDNSKFFGFGISHKAKIKLRDINRELKIAAGDKVVIHLGVMISGSPSRHPMPDMYVTEVNRDEDTNSISITCYDALNDAAKYTVSELGIVEDSLTTSYTIKTFALSCASKLGLGMYYDSGLTEFDLEYPEGANFEGSETVRDALDAIAEATQTIYYVDTVKRIRFKRLDVTGDPVFTIDKSKRISLDSSTNRRLQTICSTTELGDSVEHSTSLVGTTQYVRDNPFWELRDDLATLVENAVAAVGNMTINQFDCTWRGEPALEPGDKIALVTKDNKTVTSYLINDTLSFNGGLSEKTSWSYTDSEGETANNPTSLGEALKQTYAKVDKQKKQIELVASEVSTNGEAITSLLMDTTSILASVEEIKSSTENALEGVNSDLNTLTNKVNAAITSEDVKIQIESELANGVDKVVTNTGFTFNDEGLTISKSESEMTTNIDEDGMTVKRNDTEVLIADNTGVTAYNLHAKTYLIIGEYSRLEDWEKDGSPRTACFWIGETYRGDE